MSEHWFFKANGRVTVPTGRWSSIYLPAVMLFGPFDTRRAAEIAQKQIHEHVGWQSEEPYLG